MHNESRSRRCSQQPYGPAGDIIENASALTALPHIFHVGLLICALFLLPNKRWISKNVVTLCWRQYLIPVELKRIAVNYSRRLFQRDACVMPTECFRKSHVDLMIGEPKCSLGDKGGKFFQFYSEKLVHVNAGNMSYVYAEAELVAVDRLEHVKLERT